MASPRNNMGTIQTSDFLSACSLCKKKLLPGKDIYMYRGELAFCTVACREQQIAMDEHKEKLLLKSKRNETGTSNKQ